jgi:hypothetical protein
MPDSQPSRRIRVSSTRRQRSSAPLGLPLSIPSRRTVMPLPLLDNHASHWQGDTAHFIFLRSYRCLQSSHLGDAPPCAVLRHFGLYYSHEINSLICPSEIHSLPCLVPMADFAEHLMQDHKDVFKAAGLAHFKNQAQLMSEHVSSSHGLSVTETSDELTDRLPKTLDDLLFVANPWKTGSPSVSLLYKCPEMHCSKLIAFNRGKSNAVHVDFRKHLQNEHKYSNNELKKALETTKSRWPSLSNRIFAIDSCFLESGSYPPPSKKKQEDSRSHPPYSSASRRVRISR